MSIEDLPFFQGFCRMCDDGWQQGWHERNGGNLTYRLGDGEVEAASPFFGAPSHWVPLGVAEPTMGGEYFMTTGTGCYMRNVLGDPSHSTGIVEVSPAGDAYRVVWGLEGGGGPTSEFESHLLNHGARCSADGGQTRVCYHMHGPGIIQMSYLVPLDDRAFTRRLWQTMTECVVVFPQGVGVVDWMVPGSSEIARATSAKMACYPCVVWAQHGLFATGQDFDEAFGLAHTVEKAASLYVGARAANGGSETFPNVISDDGLRLTCRDFGIVGNEGFLCGDGEGAFRRTADGRTVVGLKMRLLPGCADEYRRRHDEIWPEMAEMLRGHGVGDYSIFLDAGTGTLYASLTVEDPERYARSVDTEVCRRWWRSMESLMETNEDGSPVTEGLECVFRLD